MIPTKYPSLPKVPDTLPDEESILGYLGKLRSRMLDELSIIRKALARADANSQTVAEVYEPDEIVQYSLPKRRIESTGYKVTDFAPADHDILSATHGDTLAAAVAQGSLIYGNATPAWAALAGDNTGTRKYLSCLSNAVSWEGLTITHEMLSATHTDSTAAAVVRGDIITGQGATPTWTRLAAGAANTILAMGASEPAWTTRATLFGSGTNNYIPKFIVGATPTFGNSQMSDDGTTVSLTGNLNIPATTGTVGMIQMGGTRWIHAYGTSSFFLGVDAGNLTNAGSWNFGLGPLALNHVSSGLRNTAIGFGCMQWLYTGSSNVGAGHSCLQSVSGSYNNAMGSYCGYALTSGSYNCFYGNNAGRAVSTTHKNVFLGAEAGYTGSAADLDKAIGIGYNAQVTADNACIFGGSATDAVSVGWGGITAPSAKLHYLLADATTNTAVNMAILDHDTSGTAAAGFGSGILGRLQSSTTASQDAAQIAWSWTDATHASRTSKLSFQTVTSAAALAVGAQLAGAVWSVDHIAELTASHGVAFDNIVSIPGSTSDSTLRIGAQEFQSYSVNNNWFGDNVYYNAGFKYRADGYASLIRFYNGQILLRAFASGSAGGAASEIDAFKTYSTGPCEATIALYTPQLLVDHITEKTGSHGIVLDSETYIGGTTNGVKIEVGGNLTLLGTATQWEDLRIEPVARTTGANAPTFEKWYDDAAGTSRGVYLYSFDDATAGSEKEVFFSMQMPHAWAATAISMHVHWVGAVDDTTADPRWGLEYTWKDIGEVYGDTTIVYSDGTHMTTAGADANVTAHKHYLTEFADITPGTAADGLSSIFIGRLFRDSANAADTYNATGAKCGLLFVDAHVEINSFGSKEEYTK